VPADSATAEQPFKRLFEQLEDPVVEFRLADGEPIIVEVNNAFLDTFAPETDSLTGDSLNDLIVPPEKQQEAEAFDRRTESGESNAAVVERLTDDGLRRFVYRSVPCEGECAFAIYTDVTEKLRRQQHLDVLQRVLRHNLRNDLSVVLGLADEIRSTAETEHVRESAASIKETAARLARLSEEAKLVQQVLGETLVIEPTSIDTAVSRVVADCRERFPDAEITTDYPPELRVNADENVETVVETLVDNAVRHNTADKPEVTVEVTRTGDDHAELVVADNGPGIPETERRVVTGDAEITPLNHGSGLGLWLVKWITDGYGADLAIETPPSGGTVVRIGLTVVDDG
jgi:PAS domain S-box-containing protein